MKNKTRKRKSLIAAILTLLFFSNIWISNGIAKLWEPPLLSVEALSAPYDIGIVLSGYGRLENESPDQIQLFTFNGGANRLTKALELYRLGKLKKILITGGAGNVLGKKISESTHAKNFLSRMGIPERDILLEPSSRNTYENALFTANLLKELTLTEEKLLLITDAFHLPRAQKCFTKVGLTVTPFPSDSSIRRNIHIDGLVPSLEAISFWQQLIKEWVGCLAYKISGYI